MTIDDLIKKVLEYNAEEVEKVKKNVNKKLRSEINYIRVNIVKVVKNILYILLM